MVSKEYANLLARRRRREFTITWRTVHFNYNLYRTSSFQRPFNAQFCYNEHLREGHTSETAHHRDRHIAIIIAAPRPREFDFFEREPNGIQPRALRSCVKGYKLVRGTLSRYASFLTILY